MMSENKYYVTVNNRSVAENVTLEYAPEWDGHTPAQAIERIGKLEPVRHGRWIQSKTVPTYHHCSLCKATHRMKMSCNFYVFTKYCPNCGADMRGINDE